MRLDKKTYLKTTTYLHKYVEYTVHCPVPGSVTRVAGVVFHLDPLYSRVGTNHTLHIKMDMMKTKKKYFLGFLLNQM
jgi:hypothetical protein